VVSNFQKSRKGGRKLVLLGGRTKNDLMEWRKKNPFVSRAGRQNFKGGSQSSAVVCSRIHVVRDKEKMRV